MGGYLHKDDTQLMSEPTIFEAHDSYVLALLFTGDSRTLISAGMDKAIKFWSVANWNLEKTLIGHDNSVNSIRLSPDQKFLISGSSDNTVKIWSFPDGTVHHTLQDRKKTVSSVAISADGQWVGAAFYGGRAMIWNMRGVPVVGIKASKKNLSSVAFSPDNQVLATSGLGDDIELWKLPSGEHLMTLTGHQVAVGSLRFILEGRYLISLGYEQTIKLWETVNWQEARTIRLDTQDARGLSFSPDEKTMALIMEGRVQLWSVGEWAILNEIPIGTPAVNSVAFSADGRWLAVGAADKKIRIWHWS